MTNWISNFVVSISFLSIMSSKAGEVLAWNGLSGVAAVCLVFVYFCVPETKGKSLE